MFANFPIGLLGHVWCLIVSTPLSYFGPEFGPGSRALFPAFIICLADDPIKCAVLQTPCLAKLFYRNIPGNLYHIGYMPIFLIFITRLTIRLIQKTEMMRFTRIDLTKKEP